MATPHVAAAAALLKSYGVSDPDDVHSILTSSATDIGPGGYDTTNGYGLLNIEAALELAASGNTPDNGSGNGGSEDGTDGGNTDDGNTGNTGADTTAPNLTNVTGYTQGTRFTIEWVTNEAADSYLNFEDYGLYGDNGLTTSHSITLRGAQGETYYFDLESTDAAGNTGTDGTYYISL